MCSRTYNTSFLLHGHMKRRHFAKNKDGSGEMMKKYGHMFTEDAIKKKLLEKAGIVVVIKKENKSPPSTNVADDDEADDDDDEADDDDEEADDDADAGNDKVRDEVNEGRGSS